MSKDEEGKNPNLGFESIDTSSKGKGKTHALGFESEIMSENGEAQNPKLGVESNNAVNLEMERKDVDNQVKEKKKKKKKKRKREELEIEGKYEAKLYGVVAKVEAEGGEGDVGRVAVGEKRKTVDNVADMLVSKEGFDDENKLLRTVFVGNLPLKVKKKALLKEFSQFGEIESVRIRSVPLMDTKRPRKSAIMKKQINDSVDRVHAYVVFKIEESAQASLAHNMAVVGGNHIRVDRACPPRKKLKGDNASLYDNKRTVFMGNLPLDVKDEEIYQLFCGINQLESSIEAVRVIRDCHSSLGKGIAYVLFKTRDAANLVVKKRNLKLRDRDIRLSHARSDSTPSKRKNPSTAWTGNSPAKKLAFDSRSPSDSINRAKTKPSTSYQGLRASKSGVQKKVHTKITEPVKLKPKTQKAEKLKVRKTKRPAVAARKANAPKGGGASNLAGKKRKLESQTPESSHRNKKAKKYR
ncbi:hypothetical protein L1049_022160 [Liquidambar formosana]|uniref:RRM domain-containing protein n=1 Tax=Liquidambar formosana TaxID=63359 RepID=A0AAP0RDV9_LIQFO